MRVYSTYLLIIFCLSGCFRIVSTIPKRDFKLVHYLETFRQRDQTGVPVIVAYFNETDNNRPAYGFLRVDFKKNFQVPRPLQFADSTGRLIRLLAPGNHHLEGMVLGYRVADAGRVHFSVGDSVVVRFTMQIDPTPLY